MSVGEHGAAVARVARAGLGEPGDRQGARRGARERLDGRAQRLGGRVEARAPRRPRSSPSACGAAP